MPGSCLRNNKTDGRILKLLKIKNNHLRKVRCLYEKNIECQLEEGNEARSFGENELT